MTISPLISSAVVTLAAGAVLAGCGSSNDSGSSSSQKQKPAKSTSSSKPSKAAGGGTSVLKLAADKSGALKFDTDTLSTKAGSVTVEMDNPSQVPHAIAVEGNGVDKDGATVSGGGTSKVTVALKPGKYEFYCPVDGHKAAGMEGKLIVK